MSAYDWSLVSRGARRPWSWVKGAGTLLAAPEAAGFQGAGTPFGRWGLGSAEGSPLVRNWLDAGDAPQARGMQRESAASPLPR